MVERKPWHDGCWRHHAVVPGFRSPLPPPPEPVYIQIAAWIPAERVAEAAEFLARLRREGDAE